MASSDASEGFSVCGATVRRRRRDKCCGRRSDAIRGLRRKQRCISKQSRVKSLLRKRTLHRRMFEFSAGRGPRISVDEVTGNERILRVPISRGSCHSNTALGHRGLDFGHVVNILYGNLTSSYIRTFDIIYYGWSPRGERRGEAK